MMAYDIYGDHLRPGHCEVHPDITEDYPCSECLAQQSRHRCLEPQPPEPNYCEMEGHPYHGDDSDGGRCYCGEKRYPAHR